MNQLKNARTALALSLLVGCQPRPPTPPDAPAEAPRDAATDASAAPQVSTRLEAFGSAAAVRAWLAARPEPRYGRRGGMADAAAVGSLGAIGSGQGYGTGAGRGLNRAAAPPPTPAPGSRVGGAADTITNNQVEGVDEGDIVKPHGDHLVVLRRGRLFSVGLGGGALTPVSMVDAYGRGRAAGGWYDEMLIDGDTIVVIGYSYRARATEVGLFDINAAGVIQWRDTMFVRSSDYYSSRNYASRLVGHHLVMYMPVPLEMNGQELSLAAVRHTPEASWETVMDYNRLYRPVQPTGYRALVHTVMSCDLAQRGFDCHAVGVVGPYGRSFYVSGSAVYLWVDGERAQHRDPRSTEPEVPPAVLYRMPLDCGAIGAVKTRGAPVDQFSFDERGGTLRVLLRAEGAGDAMWAPESTGGDIGFLRVPLGRFSEEVPTMAASAYRGLPALSERSAAIQNRFVGDHVLYGAGDGFGGGDHPGGNGRPVWVYDTANDRTTRLDASHSIERIEPMGRDALLVGNEPAGLTFSAVALDATPTIAGRHTVRNAAQGESRSHGFFYLPDGDRTGTLGLPITVGEDGGGWRQLQSVSSSVLFLGVQGLQFRELGGLRSAARSAVEDHCVASCSDWYGNSRPIFWRDRVFALLGYELVEGAITAGRVRETRRVDVLHTLLNSAADRSANVFNNIPD